MTLSPRKRREAAWALPEHDAAGFAREDAVREPMRAREAKLVACIVRSRRLRGEQCRARPLRGSRDVSKISCEFSLRATDQLGSPAIARRRLARAKGGSQDSPAGRNSRHARTMRGRAMRMTFSKVGAVGRGLLRNENVSLPHLRKKVILGRVAAVDDNGFYQVETGFKT